MRALVGRFRPGARPFHNRNYSDIKRELVDLAIEQANELFRMSNLGHVKLRLVHAYQTDYVEEGAHFDHVWRFADTGDGYMEAHEIGRIIGARHDLSIDRTMTPFPYGHGYVNGTKWRDIMSYKESCGGCPRVPVWSSPKVLVKGDPAGTSELDNARVIEEQAARVAAFR